MLLNPLAMATKGAFAVDVVCVRATRMATTEFLIKFPSGAAPGTAKSITDATMPILFFCNKKNCEILSASVNMASDKTVYFSEGPESEFSHFPSERILQAFSLQKGRNCVQCGNEALGYVEFSIYLWDATSRIVVVDVDGTLTRSNIRGYFETVFLGTYDYIHVGVVMFLLFLDKMGLKILYLTARPRSHVEETRELLSNMTEGGNYLPAGPLFTHRGGRMTTLYMELISESTASFKRSVMQEVADVYRRVALMEANIRLIEIDGKSSSGITGSTEEEKTVVSEPPNEITGSIYSFKCPFILGIGNKDTDATAYYGAGVPIENILIMQKSGAVIAGGFSPCPEDFLAHRSSHTIAATDPTPDDVAAAAATADSLAASSALNTTKFSSYSDNNLLSYTKHLILSSSKVIGYGGQSHGEDEGLGSADV